MVLAAAGLSDVGVRYPLEPVPGRVEHDRLALSAGALLALAERVELAAHVGHAARERVAAALELRERLQARAGAGAADGGGRGGEREGGRHMARQLLLEPRYLAAQRGAGGALVALGGGGEEWKWFERGPHGQPPIGALGFVPQKTWVPSIPTT